MVEFELVSVERVMKIEKKSSSGKHHSNNCFRQVSSVDAKICVLK